MPQNKQKKNDISEGNQLLGWPGYRTRPNRSGFDPLDTRNEAAHMGGTFLRDIFALRARTRNPFYLGLMFIFGVVPFLALVALTFGGIPTLNSFSLVQTIYLVLFILATGAVTINFLFSILEILGFIPSRKQVEVLQVKEHKKKLPKRRKDFR